MHSNSEVLLLMKRFFSLGILLGIGLLAFPVFGAPKDDKAEAKEALQALNDYVGEWKGSGAPAGARPGASGLTENFGWSWRFKGDDAWMTWAVKDGKNFKSGELRYLPEKKRYQFTVVDTKDNKRVFEGELKDEILTLERVDPDTKELQRMTMKTPAEGVRFVYTYDHKPKGRTVFIKDFQVASTKEGLSLGGKEKKVECVVSGGLGTIPVSYNGEMFYVCCSGCKDAFNENPAKYVAEFKAKKAKK